MTRSSPVTSGPPRRSTEATAARGQCRRPQLHSSAPEQHLHATCRARTVLGTPAGHSPRLQPRTSQPETTLDETQVFELAVRAVHRVGIDRDLTHYFAHRWQLVANPELPTFECASNLINELAKGRRSERVSRWKTMVGLVAHVTSTLIHHGDLRNSSSVGLTLFRSKIRHV